jgi:hypothetical protein
VQIPPPAREVHHVTSPADQMRAATVLAGMPVPVGRPLQVDPSKLTGKERAALLQSGWDGQSAIPENFGELATLVKQSIRDSTDPNRIPPPVPLDTPPASLGQELDINDLPPEQQREYKAIIQEMFAQAEDARREQQEALSDASLPPSLRQAVQTGAAALPIKDDLSNPHYPPSQARTFSAPPPPQQAPAPQAPAPRIITPNFTQPPPAPPQPEATEDYPKGPNGERLCRRCLHPVDHPSPVVVTEADKEAYIESLLGDYPMTKTYEVLRGRLKVTVRVLTIDEWDLLWKQCYADERLGRVATAVERVDNLARYRTALQIVRLSGLIQASLPDNVKGWGISLTPEEVKNGDTELRQIYQFFRERIAKTEDLHRILQNPVVEFYTMMQEIERTAGNANF